MKRNLKKGLAIVITTALAIGMLLINPFALNAEAATLTGYRYNGGGTNGSTVHYDGGDSSTKLFNLSKRGATTLKALCVDPYTGIQNTTYSVTTNEGISEVVINALYDASFVHTDSEHIAAAQGIAWE